MLMLKLYRLKINIKLLNQLESGFEIIISWKKYQSKMTEQEQSRYLDYLIDPSF